MTVADLMSTQVLTLQSHETISAADAEMTWAHIRHLPVTDADGRFIGLVSCHDVRREFARDRDRTALPVARVMHEQAATVRAETALSDATAMMLENKLSALPSSTRTTRSSGSSPSPTSCSTRSGFSRAARSLATRSRGDCGRGQKTRKHLYFDVAHEKAMTEQLDSKPPRRSNRGNGRCSRPAFRGAALAF